MEPSENTKPKKPGRPRGKSDKPYEPQPGSVADRLTRLLVGQVAYVEFDNDFRSPANALSAMQSVIKRQVVKAAKLDREFKTELVTVVPSTLNRGIRYAVRVERVR